MCSKNSSESKKKDVYSTLVGTLSEWNHISSFFILYHQKTNEKEICLIKYFNGELNLQ